MKVTLKSLLDRAEKEQSAVGCFTVPNMEILMAAIEAAEEMETPIAIQIAEGRIEYSPIDYIGPMMVSAAENAGVDVCVHLDHGLSKEMIKKALAMGFSSVMFDGSRSELEENIRHTQEIVEIAGKYGASVEAEIGSIGGKEATENQDAVLYSSIEDVKRFSDECRVDALAVAIGNAHGHYHGAPKLNMKLLKNLSETTAFPLVLHGGSGISGEGFRECIRNGIRKINIATSILDAYGTGIRTHVESTQENNYYRLNEMGRKYVKEEVKKHIRIFNNKEALQ